MPLSRAGRARRRRLSSRGRRQRAPRRFSRRAGALAVSASSASSWCWWSRSRRRPAQDAAELIETEYEDLPVEAGEVIADGAVRLHEDLPDNLAFDYEYGRIRCVLVTSCLHLTCDS